jgi:hypothetical protein
MSRLVRSRQTSDQFSVENQTARRHASTHFLLALALLVAPIGANNVDSAFAPDDFAILANFTYASADLHRRHSTGSCSIGKRNSIKPSGGDRQGPAPKSKDPTSPFARERLLFDRRLTELDAFVRRYLGVSPGSGFAENTHRKHKTAQGARFVASSGYSGAVHAPFTFWAKSPFTHDFNAFWRRT